MRRVPTTPLLALLAVLLGSPGTATAEVLAQHTGKTDPVTEGFVRMGGVLSSGPVTADGGYDAWQVTGSSGTGYYHRTVDYSGAFVEGWRMTGRVRVASGSGVAYFGLNPSYDRPRFDVHLERAGGDAVVTLYGASPSLAYVVPGAADVWLLLELIYDPATARAHLLIDGIERLTGYAGWFGFNENRGLLFGTAGPTANFNLAKFKTGMGEDDLTLTSLTLKKPTVAGCKPMTGTVRLSAPAPAGGAVVTLSETLASGSVPASVTIPAGATSKTFKVTTAARSDPEAGTVSATYGGTTLTKPLTIRPMSVLSIPITPTTLVGGGISTGVVKLECKAAPGPILVEFGSTLPDVAGTTVPNVLIPAGVQTAPVTVTTSPVTSTKKPKITATANGLTRSKTLTVTP